MVPTDALGLDVLVLAASLFAGGFGSMVGIGGGLIIVPVLAGLMGVDIHLAVASSLLGIIATSAAGSATYLKSGLVDRPVGLLLLVATALGGIAGGYVAGFLSARVIAAMLGIVLAAVALRMVTAREPDAPPEPTASGDGASFIEPTTGERVSYEAGRAPLASVVSLIGGAISGLVGIGGGVINVPTMHVLMGVPIRVATATSTYMLGPTAAASAVIYLARGQVDPLLAAPVVVGMFVGARVGARLAHRVAQAQLKLAFVAVAAFFAAQMLLRATGVA